MAESRVTRVIVQVEYQPESFIRLTRIPAMVEYQPVGYLYLTRFVIMVEYGDASAFIVNRVFGPAVQ